MDSEMRDVDSSASQTFEPFTKAERIQQLNDIDKSITALLQSAGFALQTLTKTRSASPPPPTAEPASSSSSSPRDAFRTATDAYLRTLHSIDVRLRRQILGLSESGITSTEAALGFGTRNSGSSISRAGPAAATAGRGEEISGRAGALDLGWLNSRSSKVDREMETELWRETRRFVERTCKEQREGE